MNKKAIGSVISVLILLSLVVVATVSFQTWYTSFSTSTFTNIETDSEQKINIEALVNGILYIESKGEQNLNALIVKDEYGTQLCSFSGNSAVDSSSLVLQFTFDEIINNSGTLYVNDSSLNDNNGLIISGHYYNMTAISGVEIEIATTQWVPNATYNGCTINGNRIITDNRISNDFHNLTLNATTGLVLNNFYNITCPTIFVNSPLGTAMDFNGIYDLILVENSASLDTLNEDFTIVMSFNADAFRLTPYSPLISKRNVGGFSSFDWELFFNNYFADEIQFWYRNSTSALNQNFIPLGLIPDEGVYNTLIVNKKQTNISLYLNNQLIGIENVSLNTLTGDEVIIGAFERLSPNSMFDGKIDEVRLYNSSLSVQEMQNLYWGNINSLSDGMNTIDVSISCYINSEGSYDVAVITNKGVAERTFYSK